MRSVPARDALTFFVGSLFFTTAGYLTYVQVVREDGHRWFGWMPRSLGFWAASVQLVGTLYFNVTTFAGLLDVPADLENRVVWRPDAIGSVCFLVASAHRLRRGRAPLVVLAARRARLAHHGAQHVGFGLLRVVGRRRALRPVGSITNVQLANGGTFLGAVCFLVASLLMMGEGKSG